MSLRALRIKSLLLERPRMALPVRTAHTSGTNATTATTTSRTRQVDKEDLLAFEESFSSDDSFEELLVQKTTSVVKAPSITHPVTTPVKPHNKIFENDFDSSFSDIEEVRPILKPCALPNLKTESSVIEISALETSSPSFHRTETLNQTKKVESCLHKLHSSPIFTSTLQWTDNKLEEGAVDKLDPFKGTSLYPQIPPHESKFATPQLIPKPQQFIMEKKPKSMIDSHMVMLTQFPSHTELSSRLDQTRNMSTIVPNDLLENMMKEQDKAPVELRHQQSHLAKTVKPIILSSEQKKVQDLVLDGKSLFYTGSAGTGKSILLKSIIKALKMKYAYQEGALAVTASTGLAAVNIGGTTLHSFAGIGLGKEPYQDLVKKIRRSRKSRRKWLDCKVLIIDEVSMISGELFDKLNDIACTLRKNPDPFGGIQVVACGDFFQLPPVIKDDEDSTNRFCFNCQAWKNAMSLNISLTQVFRQKGDLEFIEMLNDMRLGIVSDKAEAKFRELERELPTEDGIVPAELFSTRTEVDKANNYRLRRIDSPLETFNATDGGTLTDPSVRDRMLLNFMAPERLDLKVGAQVMMIKNMDSSLVNGSLGKVVGFVDSATFMALESVADESVSSDAAMKNALRKKRKESPSPEDFEVSADFIPLENISSDEFEDSAFEFLNHIVTDDAEAMENITRKKKLVKSLHRSSRGKKLPMVRFLTPDGQTRTVCVQAETWTVEDEKGTPLVSRTQLPLILAWSLSIHKSQGQTLPKVRVNLGKVFEKGQAYVALSRAVSRDGLQVLNFNRDKVFVHHEVRRFYEDLKDVRHYMPKENGEEATSIDDSYVDWKSDEEYFDAGEMIDDSEEIDILPRPKKRKYHET